MLWQHEPQVSVSTAFRELFMDQITEKTVLKKKNPKKSKRL